MAIAGVSLAAARSVTQTGQQVDAGQSTLGKNDFLKLMITKLRYNDALAGDQDSTDTQFITQMAQFTSLEQMDNLNTTMQQVLGLQRMNQGASFLGRDVEARLSETGETITGRVTAIEFDGGSPVLVIGDTRVPVADVRRMV